MYEYMALAKEERGHDVSHLPDEILARRAALGKIECFEELLTRYRNRVYRLCYRMAGNREDAEDWTQECFVRVYQQLRHYHADRAFNPWLLRVVSNTCINLAKARSRRTSLLQEQGDFDALPFDAADPQHHVLAQAENQEIQAALESLSPILRQTLVLWAQEELTFRELGEIMGIPLSTASARVQRALFQLRSHLQSEKKRV